MLGDEACRCSACEECCDFEREKARGFIAPHAASAIPHRNDRYPRISVRDWLAVFAGALSPDYGFALSRLGVLHFAPLFRSCISFS